LKLSEKSSRRCGVALRDVEKAHFSARLALHIPAKFTVVGSSYPFSDSFFRRIPFWALRWIDPCLRRTGLLLETSAVGRGNRPHPLGVAAKRRLEARVDSGSRMIYSLLGRRRVDRRRRVDHPLVPREENPWLIDTAAAEEMGAAAAEEAETQEVSRRATQQVSRKAT
jgi:hypothetical protein